MQKIWRVNKNLRDSNITMWKAIANREIATRFIYGDRSRENNFITDASKDKLFREISIEMKVIGDLVRPFGKPFPCGKVDTLSSRLIITSKKV